MCINISCDLISFYIRFIGILLMIIFASKNKIVLYDSQSMISNRDKGEDARFINIISKSHSDFLKKYGHEWAKQIYKQKDNLNCQKYEITFSNVAIDYWNKYIKDEKVKMINIKHFDHIDLIEKNKVSCTLTKLIEYFHFFAEAEKANKEYEVVYLSYLFDIICCGGKIEFNDIVDMNLLLVALKTKNTFVTSEKKILRVIKNFEKNAKLSNAVSKQILLIK